MFMHWKSSDENVTDRPIITIQPGKRLFGVALHGPYRLGRPHIVHYACFQCQLIAGFYCRLMSPNYSHSQ